MKVNIIKEAEVVDLHDDITCYVSPLHDNKSCNGLKPGYQLIDSPEHNIGDRKEYPIHTIKWVSKDSLDETYNYVLQDKPLERLIQQYNREWETLNNKIFELEGMNVKYVALNNHLSNMSLWKFIKRRFKSKFKK